MFVDEGEELAHLERDIEEFLIDELCGIVLTEGLLNTLQVPLEISKFILFGAWTYGRAWLPRTALDILKHSVDLGFYFRVDSFLNRVEELFAQEFAILELDL